MLNDPYVYDNGTLINKLNIKDEKILKKAERKYTKIRERETLPKGNFDYAHLKAIHYHLFQDVYDWAGKERTVNIAKNDLFCLNYRIESETNKTLDKLEQDDFLKGIFDKDIFIKKFTSYFADINAYHPFREGNGRTTRAFFSHLAKEAGYRLDFAKLNINNKEWISASIESFNGNNSKLENIISNITTKTFKQKRLERRAKSNNINLSR